MLTAIYSSLKIEPQSRPTSAELVNELETVIVSHYRAKSERKVKNVSVTVSPPQLLVSWKMSNFSVTFLNDPNKDKPEEESHRVLFVELQEYYWSKINVTSTQSSILFIYSKLSFV